MELYANKFIAIDNGLSSEAGTESLIVSTVAADGYEDFKRSTYYASCTQHKTY